MRQYLHGVDLHSYADDARPVTISDLSAADGRQRHIVRNYRRVLKHTQYMGMSRNVFVDVHTQVMKWWNRVEHSTPNAVADLDDVQ